MVLPTAATALQILDEPVDPFADLAMETVTPETVTPTIDPFANIDAAPEAGAETDAAADQLLIEEPLEYDLWLDVLINGQRRKKIVAIHHGADGTLSATRGDLAAIGLMAPQTGDPSPEARIALADLPDVTYVFDEIEQTIDFFAPETARARQIIDARARRSKAAPAEDDPDGPTTTFGAVLNYDIYASASVTNGGAFTAPAPAGSFEAKLFGPFGLLEQSFSVQTEPLNFRRLNTTWSTSDPAAMRTWRAGDIVTSALGWTRPTRLGGIQMQNDFGLRSDIVTYPVPSITGSAALPSAVEIYINDKNRYSGEVLEGPFEIANLPIVTGAGTIELVVKDAAGNEVTTKADYFASPQLLKPGLFDYSAEIGFARTGFGTNTDTYDRRLMGSGSIRAGVTDWLTWEGHAEGGLDLISAGSGVVATLGRLGIGQFSVAASKTAEATGAQVTGSLQLSFGNVAVGARAQKSFGRFEDIASYTAPGITDRSSGTPSSLYQLSLSLPMPFENGGRASLSYTHLEPASGDPAQLIAASYGQKLFGGSGSASAYADLKSGRYGASLGLWMPLGNNLSTRASMRQTDTGTVLTASLGNGGGSEVGDVGWLLNTEQGKSSSYAATVRTKLPVASVRGRLTHRDARTTLNAQMSGAVVAADGGLFIANRIRDAFAIVDVGAPNIPVFYQNRPVGVTGANGKLLVPGLSAYEKNRISIDPTNLPLDLMVENTTAIAIPAAGSGVVVRFGKHSSGGTALVSFRDAAGEFLPLASTGSIGDGGGEFTVGYDGEALLEGLGADNVATIALADGGSCIAEIPYADEGSNLVSIADIVCLPV